METIHEINNVTDDNTAESTDDEDEDQTITLEVQYEKTDLEAIHEMEYNIEEYT